MLEFLWWAFIFASSTSGGYYAAGAQGATFLGAVAILGGLFLLIEKWLQPMLDLD